MTVVIPLTPERTHDLLTRLIGRLAADVQDEHTLVEHIRALRGIGMSAAEREHLITAVAEIWGHSSSGYHDPERYLDALHHAMGYWHEDLLRDLRRHAAASDPRPDHKANYGAARSGYQEEPERLTLREILRGARR